MPQYPKGFNAKDYDELKKLVVELGRDGSFNANDLVWVYLDRSVGPVNGGSVAQILDDLVDLGEIRRLPQVGHGPPRWELEK